MDLMTFGNLKSLGNHKEYVYHVTLVITTLKYGRNKAVLY